MVDVSPLKASSGKEVRCLQDNGPLNYLTLYDNYLNYTIAYIVIFIA